MFKRFLIISCMFVSMSIKAQNADLRISQLLNESNWFELEYELKNTSPNSVSLL